LKVCLRKKTVKKKKKKKSKQIQNKKESANNEIRERIKQKMIGFKAGSKAYLEELFNNPPMIYYTTEELKQQEQGFEKAVWK